MLVNDEAEEEIMSTTEPSPHAISASPLPSESSAETGPSGGNDNGGGPCGSGTTSRVATSVMNAADYVTQELPDTKECIEELCPVCGDKVSGYHYGLLTCESCKGFFKRTVQNKKVYTCVAERNCHIDKSQRKRCPFCRFQKCLDVGMKLEAVRADRMRGGRNKFGPMYKRDRARKLQLMRQRQMAAQQGRTQCQMGSEVACSLATATGPNGSSLPYSPTPTSGTPLFWSPNGGVQIKQELIQIPQLSSSTSSPDSSPSPLPSSSMCAAASSNLVVNGPVGSSAMATVHNSGPSSGAPPPSQQQQQQQQQHHHHPHHASAQIPIDHHHKITWAPHTPTTPSSSTPSPHTASPKTFHYDASTVSSGAPSTGSTVAASGSSAVAGTVISKIPALIQEVQTSTMDDKEWQNQLFALLQNQTYNQCEVDLFELMCKVLDQSLFAQVDWARNSIFFKDLKVDDQMKLLQHSWSDMLILDHVHHRLHNNLLDETTLPNGQKFNLLLLAVLGLPSLIDQFNELSGKLQDLKFDSVDYVCLKFMILLNPDVRLLVNRKHILEALEQVKQALHEYSLNCYPQIQDKFNKLLQVLHDIHMLSARGEEYLYFKHIGGGAPTQTLLMEMLHAKKK